MEMLSTPYYSVRSIAGGAHGVQRAFGGSGFETPNGDELSLNFTQVGGASWTGHFVTGVTKGRCFVVATPSDQHCCVVAEGQGYLVDVQNPDRTIVLPACDIVDVVGGEKGMLVLVTFTNLIGIVQGGRWWRSERLASDGIRDVTLSGNTIKGKGWQAHSDEWTEFQVDPQTGTE